jgi:hypothetical protein
MENAINGYLIEAYGLKGKTIWGSDTVPFSEYAGSDFIRTGQTVETLVGNAVTPTPGLTILVLATVDKSAYLWESYSEIGLVARTAQDGTFVEILAVALHKNWGNKNWIDTTLSGAYYGHYLALPETVIYNPSTNVGFFKIVTGGATADLASVKFTMFVYGITVVAPTGCGIKVQADYDGAPVIDVPAGSSQSIVIPRWGRANFTAVLEEGYEFSCWTINGGVNKSVSPATLDISKGDTISANVLRRINISTAIVAPSGCDVEYVFFYDGYKEGSGIVYRGESYAKTIVTDGRPVSVHLVAINLGEQTFLGWTKDGEVVDRWSNPVILPIEASCAISCVTGEKEDQPLGSQEILCDRYGNILYADRSADRLISVKILAEFTDEITHVMSWSLRPNRGESLEGEGEEVNPTFSLEKDILVAGRGSGSGNPIYDDKKVERIPNLVSVKFRCQEEEHEYNTTIEIGGSTVYHQEKLSGTFEKTFEVPS